MKVAITGANGFVGEYLIQELIEQGDEVLAIGWVKDPFKEDFDTRVEQHLTDFSRDDLNMAFKGVDAIVHLSAMRTNPQADAQGFHPYYMANVLNTENIILAAQDNNISRICQASSIAVYSTENKVPYQEHEAAIPLSFYGMSKLACEHLAALYMRQSPLKIVSLRFAQIFGFGEIRGLSITRFIQQARSSHQLTIWGKGVTARDYIYVKDIVGAIKLSITPDAPSGIFNISSGVPISVREVAETVNNVFNPINRLVFDLSKNEVGDCYYMDQTHTQEIMKWIPVWTLKSALEDMKLLYEKDR